MIGEKLPEKLVLDGQAFKSLKERGFTWKVLPSCNRLHRVKITGHGEVALYKMVGPKCSPGNSRAHYVMEREA